MGKFLHSLPLSPKIDAGKNKNMKKLKFKHKALIGTIGLAIFVVALQMGMQFIQSYKFVGFVARNESNWIGIAETAQADNISCQQELEQVRNEKDQAIQAANPDLK